MSVTRTTPLKSNSGQQRTAPTATLDHMDMMALTQFAHSRLDEIEGQVWSDLIAEYPGKWDRHDLECKRWLQGRALGVPELGEIRGWRRVVDTTLLDGHPGNEEFVRSLVANWATHPEYDPAWERV